MIYMDNAATTMIKPKEVIEAVVNAMTEFGNAGRGAHESSLKASRIIYETREMLCDLFGGNNSKEIVFTANATESLNIAIKGLIKPNDRVITTVAEHNSVLRPLYECEENGAKLNFVGSDSFGLISYDELEKFITEDIKAVVCTAGSNLTGNLTDLKRIGEMTSKKGVLLIVDAAQTAGIFPIDVELMHIDVLCFTGHKSLLAPQGTGGMWVREGVNIKPLLTGGSGILTYSKKHPTQMPTALEAGTLNGHGIAGLFAALKYIEKIGMSTIREKEISLMNQFHNGIKNINGVKIYGDFGQKERCPIVSFNLYGYDSSEISNILLEEYEIATRSGAHCAPLMHEALGTKEQGAIRFSFSHQNTESEVDTAIKAIYELSKR